jgi:hypothetical protein
MPRDTPATVNLLERATGLLPSYDQRRLSDRGVLGGCREVESREPEVKLVIEPVAPTYGAARRNGRYRSARRDSSGKISHVVDPKALERMLERLSPHLDGRRS